MRRQRELLSATLPLILVAAGAFLAACDEDPVGSTCGNGVVETGESCDDSDLGGATCESENRGTGTLACSTECTFDYSGCTTNTCGDGEINGTDECDGANLDGSSCTDEGFVGGTLACSATCTFDTSGCTTCGDDEINGDDDCDGADLGGRTCVDEGFDTGTIACSGTCEFDTTGCEYYTCGNDQIEGNEACDGADLDGETCVTQNFEAGTLACAANCGAYDTSGCCNSDCTTAGATRCENDVVEVCNAHPSGCLNWVSQDNCVANSQICEDGAAGPVCVTPGDTCTSPQPITLAVNQPFHISGTDLTAIYSDNYD